jgi:RNA 3'-phosphate cyclase
VTNVRAGRGVPGLRPQHAATLKILREVCGGTLEGGHVGSTEFSFAPGTPESRSISLDLGTAASITLVLQALVPAVSLSRVGLDLDLVGGTDVPWSPTFDYACEVLSPSLRTLGIPVTLSASRRGYYPNGGGRASVRIEPCPEVHAVDLSSRSEAPRISVVSRAGLLPKRVAEQQASSAVSQLERHGLAAGTVSDSVEESDSPGSSVLVSAVGSNCYLGADSIGARGKPALRVGSEAGSRFSYFFLSGACVDPHLADMLAPLLCLAKAPSRILTTEVTEHLRTSLSVARRFVPAGYSVEPLGGAQLLTVTPGEQNS